MSEAHNLDPPYLALDKQKRLVQFFAGFLHNWRVVIHRPIHYPPFFLLLTKGEIHPIPHSKFLELDNLPILSILPNGVDYAL